MQGVYQIVFMPYKVDMWDSLESIWKAWKCDKRCECIVMPIPYFCFDGEKKEWKPAYDGDLFPKDVVVMDYRAYSLEQERPEMVFVHNPYDKYNWVTNVHPDYYSYEIKKYADKLVYVPYYVTTGKISEKHLGLSVYEHMDYMIAQSEYFKEGCKGMPYYDKILPLGSPKLDKIIHKCAEKQQLEEEWENVLYGKKSLMLNTSINCFLADSEIYIQKLWNLFRWLKNRDDIAIIWRPHPLLEATIASIRVELKEQFEQLKQFFIDEKIGIYDRTPDVTRTVAIADGYIGESATSVINLFGAAGKPIFILDNYITGAFGEEKRRIYIGETEQIGSTRWITPGMYNGIFRLDEDWEQIQFVKRVTDQPKWTGSYGFFAVKDKKIYLSPNAGTTPVVYNMETGAETELLKDGIRTRMSWGRAIRYKDKIFYLPIKSKMIAEYDTVRGTWKAYSDFILKLQQTSKTYDQEKGYPDIIGACVCGKYLWLTAEYSNQVLRFDMETGKAFFYELGDESMGFGAIEVDEENVWLEEVHTGNVIAWKQQTNEVQVYRAPDELKVRKNVTGRIRAYGAFVDMGNVLIASPSLSNGMVKIDKQTGQSSLMIPEFWADVEKVHNGYHPRRNGACSIIKKIDATTILVQRIYDLAVAIVNVETEEYEVVYPTMSEHSFEEFMQGQDGFEKTEGVSGFFRRENRFFSLEDFIDDVVNDRLEDVKKRQKAELSHMAVNLDGTCGEKVHEYMMEVLVSEYNTSQRDKVFN